MPDAKDIQTYLMKVETKDGIIVGQPMVRVHESEADGICQMVKETFDDMWKMDLIVTVQRRMH